MDQDPPIQAVAGGLEEPVVGSGPFVAWHRRGRAPLTAWREAVQHRAHPLHFGRDVVHVHHGVAEVGEPPEQDRGGLRGMLLGGERRHADAEVQVDRRARVGSCSARIGQRESQGCGERPSGAGGFVESPLQLLRTTGRGKTQLAQAQQRSPRRWEEAAGSGVEDGVSPHVAILREDDQWHARRRSGHVHVLPKGVAATPADGST